MLYHDPKRGKWGFTPPSEKSVPSHIGSLLNILASEPTDRTAAISLGKWIDSHPEHAPAVRFPMIVPRWFRECVGRLIGPNARGDEDPFDPFVPEVEKAKAGRLAFGGGLLWGYPVALITGGSALGLELCRRRVGQAFPSLLLSRPCPALVWLNPAAGKGTKEWSHIAIFEIPETEGQP